jgi:hypothetical protein
MGIALVLPYGTREIALALHDSWHHCPRYALAEKMFGAATSVIAYIYEKVLDMVVDGILPSTTISNKSS